MVPSKIDSPIWGMTTSVGMDRSLPDSKSISAARKGKPGTPAAIACFLPDYKSRHASLRPSLRR
jgi:hypothetical protein